MRAQHIVDVLGRKAGRCSGAWVAKNSRVMVEGILDNAEDCSAEEVADMFELPVEQVRRILAFASK